MTGAPYVDESLQEALEGFQAKIVPSDGNVDGAEFQKNVAQLKQHGFRAEPAQIDPDSGVAEKVMDLSRVGQFNAAAWGANVEPANTPQAPEIQPEYGQSVKYETPGMG